MRHKEYKESKDKKTSLGIRLGIGYADMTSPWRMRVDEKSKEARERFKAKPYGMGDTMQDTDDTDDIYNRVCVSMDAETRKKLDKLCLLYGKKKSELFQQVIRDLYKKEQKEGRFND